MSQYIFGLSKIGPSNPNKVISMSVFMVTSTNFFVRGLEKFISNHVSKSMRKYGPIFSNFVTGLGNFFSIPFILLFKSWFKETINTSHLDRYYLALAILSHVFLCIYLCFTYLCRHGSSTRRYGIR